MSVVDSIERIAGWLRSDVCKGVWLKPMSPDAPQTEEWDYGLVEPSVHTLYVPSHKAMPPGMVATVPSILVQPTESRDLPDMKSRELSLTLSFTAWDPGTHGPDVLEPGGDGTWTAGDKGGFTRNVDGWRDAWNFMDRALRVIEDHGGLADLSLKVGEPIAFGDYMTEEGQAETYPFWLCWCSLTVVEPLVRPRETIEEFL